MYYFFFRSENNVTNTLLDLSTEPVDQILDLSATNGKIQEPQIQNPFIPFQEKNEPPALNGKITVTESTRLN